MRVEKAHTLGQGRLLGPERVWSGEGLRLDGQVLGFVSDDALAFQR